MSFNLSLALHWSSGVGDPAFGTLSLAGGKPAGCAIPCGHRHLWCSSAPSWVPPWLGPGSYPLPLWRACSSCKNPRKLHCVVGWGQVPKRLPAWAVLPLPALSAWTTRPTSPAQPRPAPPYPSLSAWTTRPTSPAPPAQPRPALSSWTTRPTSPARPTRPSHSAGERVLREAAAAVAAQR